MSGAASYDIYWSTTGGLGTAGTKIAGATSPYAHTGLANGTTYYYVVTAVSTAGESPASSEVIAVAGAPAVDGSWGHYTEVITDAGSGETCYDTASPRISQSALTFTGSATQTGQCHTTSATIQNNGDQTITSGWVRADSIGWTEPGTNACTLLGTDAGSPLSSASGTISCVGGGFNFTGTWKMSR